MNDIDDFDVSQLRWWRCVAADQNNKIHVFIIEIDSDNVYKEFNRIRQDLCNKNWRFIEAKPISAEEQLAVAKLAQFKVRRQEHLRGLTGRHYSPFSHWRAVLFALLLILLVLWLVYHH